ncbi:MAG: hypothetical protein Q8R28_07950 [Dehalococcoidia bacterium]|nr:hypothetical protein [Dehalococcoidia bacterium]
MTIYSFTHTEQDLRRFYQERASRTLLYIDLAGQVYDAGDTFLGEAQTLARSGLVKLPRLFPRADMADIRQQVEPLIDRREGLGRVRNHAAESLENIQAGRFAYFTQDELQSVILEDTVSSVSVKQPFTRLPGLARVVFNPNLLGIAAAYLGTVPVVSYVKVVTSFLNDLADADTQFWHVDFGSYQILKALVYLTDVVDLASGPFCYVMASHRQKFPGWDAKSRFTQEEIETAYPTGRFHHCLGSIGDVWLADTTGFHKGLKPTGAPRTAVIVTYTVHPEYGFEYQPIQIPGATYDQLDPFARAAADALPII